VLYQAKPESRLCALPLRSRNCSARFHRASNPTTLLLLERQRPPRPLWQLQRAYRRLFKIADLRNPDRPKARPLHMFRDTFAVEMLLAAFHRPVRSSLAASVRVMRTLLALVAPSDQLEKRYSAWLLRRGEQVRPIDLGLDVTDRCSDAPPINMEAHSRVSLTVQRYTFPR